MAEEKTDVEEKDIEGDESKSDIKDDGEDTTGKKTEEEIEVPVRAATLQHIITRKNKKIEKLEKKLGEEEEEEKEELTPEARKAVQQEVGEAIAPLLKGEVDRETETLLNNLYQEEPEAKEYSKVIRKFISFEKNGVRPYEHIPPAVIYHHLAFGQAEITGAEKKKDADLEAGLSKNKGRQIRPKSAKTESGLPTIEEMENMDDKEFSQKIIHPTLQG